jgi:hypothetical protein
LTVQNPAQAAGQPRRFYRRRPWNILLPLLALFVIVGGVLGGLAAASAGPFAPGTTATPSASSTGGVTGAPAACNENPTLPANPLTYTFPGPANSPAGFNYIVPAQQAGLNAPIYTGAYVPLADMVQWVKTVQCAGMSALVDVDPVFDTLGNSAAQTYIRQLALNPTLKMFVVMADEVGSGSTAGTPAVVNARVAAIRAAGTNLPVIVVSDQQVGPINNWSSLSASQQASALASNVAATRAYNASFNTIGFFPDFGSATYGNESALPLVAQTEQTINGAHAISAVQAIWWWKCDPTTTATFHFANKGPGPADVVRMMRAQMNIGPHMFMIVDLEAVRGGPQGTVDDLNGHVLPIIRAVREAFSAIGH